MTAAITSITYKCGHSEDRDLASRKPFEREGFAKWLAKQPCRDCDPKQIRKRQQWIAGKRAEESAAANAAEKRFGLTPLEGPEKIRDWATRVRVELIQGAFAAGDLNEDQFASQVAAPAGEVNAAGWWLDHRDTEPEHLHAVLMAALSDDDGARSDGNENPY